MRHTMVGLGLVAVVTLAPLAVGHAVSAAATVDSALSTAVPARGEAPGKACKKPGMSVHTAKFGHLTCKAGRWVRA
jgi:hypothetical protein